MVPQRLWNATEYLIPCLIHPQKHARTHARSLLLSDAIPHIDATTTTTTASTPTRWLCSSVRSVWTASFDDLRRGSRPDGVLRSVGIACAAPSDGVMCSFQTQQWFAADDKV